LKMGTSESGQKVVNNYLFVKKLGQGSYGTVMLAKDITTEILYAIKIVDKSILSKKGKMMKQNNTAMEDLFMEIAIMKKLKHPNVVQLHEIIDDETSKKLYIVQV
jgi:serine/threonine protein kinase